MALYQNQRWKISDYGAHQSKFNFHKMARKLSKTMRRLNLIQKVVMGILAGVSLLLASLTDTDDLYYKIVSVFSSAFPIAWSHILDACKQYEDEKTPAPISPARNTPKPEEVPAVV